jgi:outer membrane receptor protein involved in Fe transport
VWRATERLDLTLGARHVGRSMLRNDGDLDNVLPAHSLLDATVGYRLGRHAIRLQAQNLTDAAAYTSGYSTGATRYFFPVASRALLATVTLSF